MNLFLQKIIHSFKTWSCKIWLIDSSDDPPNIDPSLQKITHSTGPFIQNFILQNFIYSSENWVYPKNYLFLQLKNDSFSTDVFCIFIRF